MSIALSLAKIFLFLYLLGLAVLTARLFYMLYIWNEKRVRAVQVEVLSVNWQTQYVSHSYRGIYTGGSDPVQECYALLRPVRPHYKKRKRSMSRYGNRAYDPKQLGEFRVKVYSQRRFFTFEYGGENLVTNRTLNPGDRTVLYFNSRGRHTLTHYTAKSLTRHWLKQTALWAGICAGFVLLLAAWALFTALCSSFSGN